MATIWQEWRGMLQPAYFITSLNMEIIVKKLSCDKNYEEAVDE